MKTCVLLLCLVLNDGDCKVLMQLGTSMSVSDCEALRKNEMVIESYKDIIPNKDTILICKEIVN